MKLDHVWNAVDEAKLFSIFKWHWVFEDCLCFSRVGKKVVKDVFGNTHFERRMKQRNNTA